MPIEFDGGKLSAIIFDSRVDSRPNNANPKNIDQNRLKSITIDRHRPKDYNTSSRWHVWHVQAHHSQFTRFNESKTTSKEIVLTKTQIRNETLLKIYNIFLYFQ